MQKLWSCVSSTVLSDGSAVITDESDPSFTCNRSPNNDLDLHLSISGNNDVWLAVDVVAL